MDEQLEEFINFSDKINDYISAAMVASNINYEHYHSSLIWELVSSKGVAIRAFPFNGIAKERISGMIVRDSLETTIGYNQHMTEKRKNFTISHEIVHYLFHLNNEHSIFTDTEQSLHYSYNDVLHEFQANIGASVILVPDVALFRYLKSGWSFSQISQKFGISESALYIRLIQTIQATFHVSYFSAKKKVDLIRYRHHEKGKKAAVELGINLENRLFQTNRFIEAL